jgi:ABC-type nickel/cobalt efflux system permease component RcnA
VKRVRLAVAALAGIGVAVLAPAQPADAHPLGNFSVNQLDAFRFAPDRITVTAVVDLAELPTLQERPAVDTDGDGTASDAERAAHAAAGCAALAADLRVAVSGQRVTWTVTPVDFGYAPGAAGLATSRLTCTLTAPADLARPATVDVDNRYRADRIGWRELTAAGDGVRLVDSPVPATSVSDGLRAYPQNLLSSPLDVRTARIAVEPGSGSTVARVAGDRPARADILTRWSAAADQRLAALVGGRLTPLVGMLAVLLALALGAGHAALPGHGKTVMAAYLAGRRGRPRDAVVVGATVTATHTGGVLVLGLLLTTTAGLAGETALRWLGVLSGALVATVGIVMLAGVRRSRRRIAAHAEHAVHDHSAHDHAAHDYDHADHHHDHDHGHSHGHGPTHAHGHGSTHGRTHDHGHPHGRLGLVGMGVAGGLVPSPSALVVLLGAVGLGRTGFGVLLVLAYGLGMAATLTAAGLLLVRLRDRWADRQRRRGWSRLGARIAALAPSATAALVLVVGLGLAGRALAFAG